MVKQHFSDFRISFWREQTTTVHTLMMIRSTLLFHMNSFCIVCDIHFLIVVTILFNRSQDFQIKILTFFFFFFFFGYLNKAGNSYTLVSILAPIFISLFLPLKGSAFNPNLSRQCLVNLKKKINNSKHHLHVKLGKIVYLAAILDAILVFTIIPDICLSVCFKIMTKQQELL